MALTLGCARAPENRGETSGDTTVATRPETPAAATGGMNAERVVADSAAPDPCDTASSQLAMTSCSAEQARLAEQGEGEAYTRTLKSLQQARRTTAAQRLEAAESAWRAYRDATCLAAASMYEGGSMAPLVEANCRKRIASARTAELKLLLPPD